MYAFQFLPCTIYNNHHNKDGGLLGQVRFFFSQFTGIWLMSVAAYSLYFAYSASKPKRPSVSLDAMLPAMLSGVMWAVASAGAMLATEELGYSVGYPLTLNGAFLVNVCWAVLYYKEVRGAKNLRLFAAAVCFDVLGSVLIALSR